MLAAQPPEAAAELLRRAAEVGATVAREGLEFGVVERRLAVGGQFLTLQGLGGVYDEVFLPLHGALPGAERRLRAGRGRGVLRRRCRHRPARARHRARRLRRGPLAGPAGAGPLGADRAGRRRHNPAGMRATVDALAEAFDFRQLIGVVAMLADKDVPPRWSSWSRCWTSW